MFSTFHFLCDIYVRLYSTPQLTVDAWHVSRTAIAGMTNLLMIYTL
jgi:hypothetical protein